MAGLKILWINDPTGGGAPTPGAIAKPAYRMIGQFAFGIRPDEDPFPEGKAIWEEFVDKADDKKLLFLSEKLTGQFKNLKPEGAMNYNPRVLILYDDVGPADLKTDGSPGTYGAAIKTYFANHKLVMSQDTAGQTNMVFEGNPKTLDFYSYLKPHAGDEDDAGGGLTEKQRKRIMRVFAMTLFTRCR